MVEVVEEIEVLGGVFVDEFDVVEGVGFFYDFDDVGLWN